MTGIRRDAERVVGVEIEDGGIDADHVVNAAGPWAGRVARMADIELPVAPRRRQMAVVEPERPVPESDPFTIDLDTRSYFRPERQGIALVGGRWGEDPDADPDRYREGMEIEWAVAAVERTGESTTYFGPETRIRRGWAGLYAVTPDNHPIVEETVPRLVNAVGLSATGSCTRPRPANWSPNSLVRGRRRWSISSHCGAIGSTRGPDGTERRLNDGQVAARDRGSDPGTAPATTFISLPPRPPP